jgi:hypothetical protein
MKFFLAIVGWILFLGGLFMFVDVAIKGGATAMEETEAILMFGFGVISLGLCAILGALTRVSATRERPAQPLRDDAVPEARVAPAGDASETATRDQPSLVWTGKQWKMLRPFFSPKQPG